MAKLRRIPIEPEGFIFSYIQENSQAS